MTKKIGNISKDHEVLMLNVLYSGYIDALGLNINTDDLLTHLTTKASEHYAATYNTVFEGKSSTFVRDYLAAFAPHWIAAYLIKNDRVNYNKLPTNYGIIMGK